MTPTARTLATLRRDGVTAQVVERWNPYARVRQDLFGVIDVVALLGIGNGILGIQATTGSNMSARVSKAKAEPRLRSWLESGGRFQVWGWRKIGDRGKRKTWEVRVVELAIGDLD